MGNQFLANIREVDAVAYVLRCFDDDDVTHVEGRVDPVSDADTVETELMLADLESLERRRPALEKKAKGNDKEAKATLALVDTALAVLAEGRPARMIEVAPRSSRVSGSCNFLRPSPCSMSAMSMRTQRARATPIRAASRHAPGGRRGACRHFGKD